MQLLTATMQSAAHTRPRRAGAHHVEPQNQTTRLCLRLRHTAARLSHPPSSVNPQLSSSTVTTRSPEPAGSQPQDESLRTPQSTATSQQATSQRGYKTGVVVVGGGPAGLATAMMLARRGWTDITVVEKRPGLDIEDTDKSYVYMLDGRGQKFLRQMQGLDKALGKYCVSADDLFITAFDGTGKAKTRKMTIKSPYFTARYLSRPQLLQMLHDEGLVPGREQGWGQHINLRTGCRVVGMDREANSSGGWQLSLTVEDLSTGQQEVLRPHLVVGADGIHSTVRQTLQQWAREDRDREGPPRAAAGTAAAHTFEPAKLECPSAGLKFKVLRLPANPVLSRIPGQEPAKNDHMTVVYHREGLPANRRLRLGLLPVATSSPYRTANMFFPKDGHELLNVTTAEEFYKFFEDVFPQLPVRDLVPVEEATRFVNSTGGAFPHPQYVQGMQMSSPAETDQQATDSQTTANQEPLQGYGVVLLGDARAAFPPDLGQGVNSAFGDVSELEKVLEACGDNVAEALPKFEATRLPEIKALIEMQTFAFPFQYGVGTKLDQLLWACNFVVRLALSKVLPWWFKEPAFFYIQNPEISYTTILEDVHRTTRRLVALACLLVALPLLHAAWPHVASALASTVAPA